MEPPFVSRMKRQFKNHKLYILAGEIRRSLQEANKLERRFISLQADMASQGDVLLSYIIDPFYLKADQSIPNYHTNYWESRQIARTFLDLGYSIDVVHFENDRFVPTKDYSFFIGHRRNFERIAQQLPNSCVKILHIDMAHWLFHMAAQQCRLLELQRRRGITLPLRRIGRPHWAIEHADYATILGNNWTISTYSYANKPIYPVSISAPVLYPWPEGKDFETSRRRYLWFGSDGFIRKGLDLVLEAFAEMPEYQLVVCGPVEKEKEFMHAYRKELFETRNIELVGWVDIGSQKFIEICNSCVGLIYCSCAEGQCGGVVTCIHAGLIPIISQESGVDVDDFGFILNACSVGDIKKSIQTVAKLPRQELLRRARKGWEFARANHTREAFAKRYREVILEIINSQLIKNRVSGGRELDAATEVGA